MALVFLLLVLVVAAVSTRRVAVIVSLVAFASFNFFFLSPVGTFAIAKKADLVTLFVLLAVSLIGSHLSHLARRHAEKSLGTRTAAERGRDGSAERRDEISSGGITQPRCEDSPHSPDRCGGESPDDRTLRTMYAANNCKSSRPSSRGSSDSSRT